MTSNLGEAGRTQSPYSLAPFYTVLAMVTLSNTILATALPQVSAELSGAQDYTAVVTAYLLPKALATPLGGRLVDAYTPKRVIYFFFGLYLLTTVLCGLVHSMNQLLFWRVFQGLGGGGLMASIYVTIDLTVPPRSQGKVQAQIATVLGSGAAAAPLVGGLITQYFGWRWCFFLNIPVLLFCLVGLAKMPAVRAPGKAQVDWKGSLALVLFSCPLMLALSWGGVDYSWNSKEILALFALALFAAPLFWWLEKLPDEPLFETSLTRDPIIRWSFLATFTLGGAFLGSLLYLPLFVTVVKGTSASEAGAAMLPFIIGSIVGAVFGGSRVEKTARYQKTALIGCVAACVTSGLLAVQLQGPFSDPVFYLLQFLLAFAFGASQDMYSIAVQNSTTIDRQGMTGSALEFVRQLGTALGLALVGSIFLLSLNAQMPAQLSRWLSPLDLTVDISQLEDPDKVNEIHGTILRAVTTRLEQALNGDQHAYRSLQRSPMMTETLQKLVTSSPHSKTLEKQDKIAAKAAADKADKALMSALADSIQEAQRRVYFLTSLLCFIAFLATLKLPDHELREALREN